MCFSAGASFSAGVVLSVIGVASLKKASSREKLFFAGIPFVFALQQFCEGLLWISLAEPVNEQLRSTMTYVFLIFAQVIWPIWVPYAILKMDPKEKRRSIEKFLVGVGLIVSAYLAFCLAMYPVSASVDGKHIAYLQDYPVSISHSCGFLYVVATIGPPFFSRIPKMWMLGLTILISYLITTVFYTAYIVSVWCFFASVISMAVYVIVREDRRSQISLNDVKSDHAVV